MASIPLTCGTGTNAIALARRGFEVTAVDCVPEAIDIARGKANDAQVNVDFRVADVLSQEPTIILFDRGVFHVLRVADPAKFQNMLKRENRRGSWYLSLAGNERWQRGRMGRPW